MHRPLTLMDLPAEMRLAIYAFALPDSIAISAFHRKRKWEEPIKDQMPILKPNEYLIDITGCELPKFLFTNRQIHSEAWPLFIRRLIFNKVHHHYQERHDHYQALLKRRSVIQFSDTSEIEHVIVERNEVVYPTVDTPTIQRHVWKPEYQSPLDEPPFPRLKSITITSHWVDTASNFQFEWFRRMGQSQHCNLLSIIEQVVRDSVVGIGPPHTLNFRSRTNDLAERYDINVRLPKYHAHLLPNAELGEAARMAILTCELNWNTGTVRITIKADKELTTCSEHCVNNRKITNWFTQFKDKWLELSKHYPEYRWGVCFENLLLDIVIFKDLGDKDVVYLEA